MEEGKWKKRKSCMGSSNRRVSGEDDWTIERLVGCRVSQVHNDSTSST